MQELDKNFHKPSWQQLRIEKGIWHNMETCYGLGCEFAKSINYNG